MGMTIKEHKEHLLDIMDSMPDDACGDWRDSLAYAVEIMRKYQIIVNDLKACEQDGMEFISVGFLKEIINGNVD